MEPPVDPEEMVTCPYEPAHVFKSKRLIYHLEKCRKNYPTSDFRKCDFNASHIIPTPELSFHLRICPDRGRLELEVFHENHQYKQKGDTSLPQCDWTPPEASESWDDDNVRFEPKVSEQLFEEEAAKIKPLQAKPSKKPPSPEKWRMPHSLPMTGPIKTSGGRGRGRGITKNLVEEKSTPSGLQKNGGSSLPPGLAHPSLSQPVFNAFGANGQPAGRGLAQPHMYPMALSQNPFVPPGLGRGNGYGRGALCFGRGKIPLPTHTANNVQSSLTPTPSVEEMEKKEENEEEIRKRKNIRKLKKALRQVEELELKQKSGVILTPEQFIKLSRKADLLSKLRELETDEVE